MPDFQTVSGSFKAFRDRHGLSGAFLKSFAILSMLVDHTGATIVRRLVSQAPGGSPSYSQLQLLYRLMRRFGRLAFPLFCFLLVEGFSHTRNKKKYAFRMFVFALISEFPFDYALHPGQAFFAKQNVYFTLLIGLLVLIGVQAYNGMVLQQLCIMSCGMILARLLKTDYSYHGVFLIELLYITRGHRLFQSAYSAAYLEYYENMPTPLSSLLMLFYNGKRGRQMKYFFYWFYPAHLLLLGLIMHRLWPLS